MPDELGGRVPGNEEDNGGIEGCSTIVAIEGGIEVGAEKVKVERCGAE
jgi:hypothetical protein